MNTTSTNVNSSFGLYGLYNSMFQGSMAKYSNRLTQQFFAANKKNQNQSFLASDAMQYVNNIKSASKSLSGALNGLTRATVFSKKTMVSSNADVVSVVYTDNKSSNPQPVTIKVDQIAAGQLNEGKKLNSSSSFDASGTSTFYIEAEGKRTEFSISISKTDTNFDVQQKMANAVNNAGITVKATVETNSDNNQSTLKLESTNTGNYANFTVSDVAGDLTTATGINDVSRDARDAVFSVGGGPMRTSSSNTVDLGNGMKVTLNQASTEAVTIKLANDTAPAIKAVEDFVRSFNDLYKEGIKNSSDQKAEDLASKMLSIGKTYLNGLSAIGISFDKEGMMTINTEKLNTAAENGKLQQFFTENSGRNYGFTNQISKLSNNVSSNTSNFVTKSVFANNLTENFAYSNIGELLQYNFFSTGLIFDYSF